MNKSLARAAEAAINSGSFERKKGFCLRACRQFAEAVPGIGAKYDRLFRGDGAERDATASRAGKRFLKAGLGFLAKDVAKNGGLQPGDMLVKTDVAANRWGDFSGHIGVLCMDGERVAENSSTAKGRVRGALGFRTLAQYGSFDIVVRLPDPAAGVAAVAPAAPVNSLKDSTIIIVRGGAGRRVEREQIQKILVAAGVKVEKVAVWGDGTPAVFVEGK